MLVEVLRAFRANSKIYHVGDVVDLPDAFVAELMFTRRVVPAKAPAPKRNNRRRKPATDVSDDATD